MHDPTVPRREWTAPGVGASPTATLGWPQARRGSALATVAGAFLAFTGAFGSGEAPWLARFAYWVTLMLAGAAIGAATSTLVSRRGWLERDAWLQGGLIVTLISVPLTVVAWAFTRAMFGGAFDAVDLLWFAPPVVAISAVMTALNYMSARIPPMTRAAPAPPESAEAGKASPVRFLERLPPKLRGAQVHAVEAEDHYLRVHTDRGSDLILLRLADAVAELEGIEGAQTHRSWWVARSAVLGASRGDGRATLTLPGGVAAPVSRTYAKALREAGWF